MEPLHARYPYLAAAREAVEEAGVDLPELVATDDRVVERATDRVVGAIENGTVGQPHRDARIELLSYPVARVLVSLVDEHVLTRRYAHAEAASAYRRFTEELGDTTEYRSVSVDRISLEQLFSEFDLAGHVEADGPLDSATEFSVDVPTYLLYASGLRGDEWRLVNRSLDAGRVPVDRDELYRLLQQAVHERVAEDLPLVVPQVVADPLAEETETIRETLAELDLTRDIDTVVPELFPPCMKHLLDQIRKGAHLEHHSRFAITAFLTTIGLTTDEIIDIYRVNPGFGEDITRYQTDHIRGETSPEQYTPPSCATMKSYGDCVNMDDLCDRISHPLGYYEAKLDDADDDDLEDWRDEQTGGDDEGEDGDGGNGEGEDGDGEGEAGGDGDGTGSDDAETAES